MARSASSIVRVLSVPALCASTLLAGHAAQAAMGTGGSMVKESAVAGPYRLVLQIGPLEKMYTRAQLKQQHPMSGEVMLSGTMVMGGMGGMSGPTPNHHLELHIYNRTTGTVVTKAVVAITIRTASGKLLERLPIAEMRGVTSGVSDTHFGNNVALQSGTYRVDVQVESARASFKVTLGITKMKM